MVLIQHIGENSILGNFASSITVVVSQRELVRCFNSSLNDAASMGCSHYIWNFMLCIVLHTMHSIVGSKLLRTKQIQRHS